MNQAKQSFSTLWRSARCLFFFLCLAPQTVESADKITIGYSAIAGLFGYLYVSVDGGYFRRNGIDAPLVYIGPGAKLAQTVVSGDVELGTQSPGASLGANLSGGDLVFIAGVDRRLALALVVQPEIKSVGDLKGKTIGVSQAGTSIEYGARFILEKNGLKPGTDVKILQTGGHPNSLAAVSNKLLAGAVLSFPTRFLARKAGLVELVDLGEEEVSYPGGAMTVRRAFLDSHPDLVRRMVKSYIEGIHRYRTDKAFATRTVARYARTTDLAAVEATYNGLSNALVGPKPYVPREGVAESVKALATRRPEAAKLDPRRMIRDEYVKEFDDSGYIDSLYRSR
ncbi:MAG: ABC transporter substrate-binding protein [Deltaproteobacteria bacterium]|nr:ABC transporter substrate-binding protein [Deltaproteobacteria bacterium]